MTSLQSLEDLEQIEKLRKILSNPLCRSMKREWIRTSESAVGKKGGQGTVVVGTLVWPTELAEKKPETELTVAVKKLHWIDDDPERQIKLLKLFVNEVKLTSTLNHPNIALLLGCMEDFHNGEAWLISPWEANGNVREFLQSGEWDIPERISLLHDVSNGVEYLHSQEPPICHGDLKSLNILVDSGYSAVITDFGSARTKSRAEKEKKPDLSKLPVTAKVESKMAKNTDSWKAEFDPDTGDFTLTGPGFSIPWTAPEVLDDGTQDLPSDMWALGWIAWEIVTGRLPFDELKSVGAIISCTISGKLPPIHKNQQLAYVLMLCSIMSDCWIADPTERIESTAFRQKVSLMPYTTPSSTMVDSRKVRSALLLLRLGSMYSLQDDKPNAMVHYQQALEVAARTKDEWAQANALDGLANVYSSQSKYSEAEKAFMDAHAIHSRIGNDLGAANALNGLAEVNYTQSRYSEAEKALMDAHAIYSRIENDLGTANALVGLGDVYRSQSRNSEAEKVFMDAHAIYSLIGNDLGAANALNGLGNVYRSQSRDSEAEKVFMNAHAIHFRIGHDLGAANALLGLGDVYRTQSRNSEAEKAFMDAHAIHSRIGNDLDAANALDGLAEVYRTQSRNSEAEKAFMDAHAIHSRIGDDLGAANALDGLGYVYRSQSRESEAEQAFMDAHTIYSRIGDDLGAANTLLGLGNLYRIHSRRDQAEETLLKARELYIFVGDHVGVGNSLHCLATVLEEQGRNSEAASFCAEAVNAYKSTEQHDQTSKTLLLLGRLYLAQGQYVDAENATNEALALFMSFGDEDGQRLASVQLASIATSQTSSKCKKTRSGSLPGVAEVFVHSGAVVEDADISGALGDLYAKQEQIVDAEEHYRLSQAICLTSGDAEGEAEALTSLGNLSLHDSEDRDKP